jgi:hypothetical protein
VFFFQTMTGRLRPSRSVDQADYFAEYFTGQP